MNALKSWFLRWQEYVGWLPLVVGLAIGGWIVFGALDPVAVTDALSLLVRLPMLAGYLLLALAVVYLLRRRWRYRMSGDQQQRWWALVLAHPHGAIVVLVIDAILTAVSLVVVLWFLAATL